MVGRIDPWSLRSSLGMDLGMNSRPLVVSERVFGRLKSIELGASRAESTRPGTFLNRVSQVLIQPGAVVDLHKRRRPRAPPPRCPPPSVSHIWARQRCDQGQGPLCLGPFSPPLGPMALRMSGGA
jgi:hypothetical protein